LVDRVIEIPWLEGMRIERRLGPIFFFCDGRRNRGCCLEDFEIVVLVFIQTSDFIFDRLKFWVWFTRKNGIIRYSSILLPDIDQIFSIKYF
jgi:hypothetical protein